MLCFFMVLMVKMLLMVLKAFKDCSSLVPAFCFCDGIAEHDQSESFVGSKQGWDQIFI